MLTQDTARKVNRYFKQLVKRQPMWLKMLFEGERVAFTIDPANQIGLEVDKDLPEETKAKVQLFISRYMNKHPCNFIKEEVMHVQ